MFKWRNIWVYDFVKEPPSGIGSHIDMMPKGGAETVGFVDKSE